MELRKVTAARGVVAVITTAIEEGAIWAIWRYVFKDWSVTVLIVAMSIWLAFSIWLFTFTTFTLKRQRPTGAPTMVGARGKTASALAPAGMVRIKSELWTASSIDGDIGEGEDIIVVEEKRMKLKVRRARPEELYVKQDA